MSGAVSKDLVVLVPDIDIRAVMKELLEERYSDMGFRKIKFDIVKRNVRDSECRMNSHNILREHCESYKHALVIFDLKGSGGENAEHSERFVENKLKPNGWPGDRAAAIVIDPELEAWAWCSRNSLPFVRRIFGLRSQAAFDDLAEIAMEDPKKAFGRACNQAKKRRSPELYRELAEELPVQNCHDPAFQKLVKTLKSWFP